ncbi:MULTISPECIES: hypothetical protein [Frankia]|uniref:hypothetical protein n=1 Tax=Frankia TaxID=1854 RepID=UPI001A7E989D|nr:MULTISPECIES: hypothetical protein [Frankia]
MDGARTESAAASTAEVPSPADAAAARSEDHVDARRASYVEAFAAARAAGDVEAMAAAARAAGDVEAMAAAALGLPSTQRFGSHPGQVPALLHEAYAVAVAPSTRCRLAAALARAWVYGGDAGRAGGFARQAERLATDIGDPALLADALDAALSARWGPDDYRERTRLAARLEDAAAHQADPGVRLSAHLWRLTAAWEALDVIAVQRQLRALELLAADSASPRDAFFAVSRRAMHALATADLARADDLIARTRELGAALAEPDREAVLHSLAADRALQAGDREALRQEAAGFEAFGTAEGIPSVTAEAAVFWLEAGEPDRAERLALQLAGPGLHTVARDVDFLLTVGCLVQVAAALRLDDLCDEGVALLEPYAGRGVLNAGAVTFHGVVDDYLHQACRRLGRADAARWRHSALTAYRRVGAAWWAGRLVESGPAAGDRDVGSPREPGTTTSGPTTPGPTTPSPPTPSTTTPSTTTPSTTTPSTTTPAAPVLVIHLQPGPADVWTVGPRDTAVAIPGVKGLHYLRHLVERPGQDISALVLSDAVAGHAGAGVGDSDAGELLDAQALAAYRRRLSEIDADLAEADAWADPVRLERARLERQALLDELAAATGLGGRRRRAGSTRERARVAVRKAIVAAVDRIDRIDPAVARLLRDTVRTGTTCRYDPDPSRPVRWVTGRSST